MKFSVGTDVPDPNIYPKIDGTEADNQLKNGHILWLRGIARLHTQVIKLIYIIIYNQCLITPF